MSSYLDHDELTNEQYAIADLIHEYVWGRQQKDFNGSQLARAAGVLTLEARLVLRWMLAQNYLIQVGRGGCWIRYRARRPGEYNVGTV